MDCYRNIKVDRTVPVHLAILDEEITEADREGAKSTILGTDDEEFGSDEYEEEYDDSLAGDEDDSEDDEDLFDSESAGSEEESDPFEDFSAEPESFDDAEESDEE
ncbi:MAG: hypothetical protein II680_08505, partial [Clostridia bacterium]|nr:hypothetical protein [Clostridia bacterium]